MHHLTLECTLYVLACIGQLGIVSACLPVLRSIFTHVIKPMSNSGIPQKRMVIILPRHRGWNALEEAKRPCGLAKILQPWMGVKTDQSLFLIISWTLRAMGSLRVIKVKSSSMYRCYVKKSTGVLASNTT